MFVEPLQVLCRRAADSILSHYDSALGGQHDLKDDRSPLTAADMASHHILLEGLRQFSLPVLSEESDAAVREQALHWQHYWLVDPLDGTREFLAHNGEFTINIALIEDRRAVFGMVAVPVAGEIYLGVPGHGAWKSGWRENGVAGFGAWAPIACRRWSEGLPTVVLTSRRHRGERLEACLKQLGERVARVEWAHAGSALKFCRLAAGEADFYPRFSPCSEWDTAAGQALLEGGGGAVVDLQGRPLRYNRGKSLLNPHFMAIADPAAAVWASMIPMLA